MSTAEAGVAVTQAEFARLIGVHPAHVTRLKQKGRLVMHGKLVLPELSRQRIDATGGLRPDVALRFSAGRAAPPQPADARSVEDWRDLRVKSEARRMQAQADREEMERDRLAGNLIDREDAARAMRDVGAAVRGAMENYADQVAPLVAPVSDLDEVHAILADQCRNVLHQVSEVLRKQT